MSFNGWRAAYAVSELKKDLRDLQKLNGNERQQFKKWLKFNALELITVAIVNDFHHDYYLFESIGIYDRQKHFFNLKKEKTSKDFIILYYAKKLKRI